MLMKTKKKWFAVSIVSLNIAIPLQVNAGIPVTDIGANGQLVIINSNTMQSATTLQSINSGVNQTNSKLDTANENWQKLFRELAKDKLSDIYGLDLSNDEQLSQKQYTQFQEEAKSRCQKIGNKNDGKNESRELCLKMIEIDKQKIKHYFKSLEDMKEATTALKNAIQSQQSASTQGEKDTAEHNVQNKFQDLARIQQEYELNIKILDAKKEFMRQRREDIAEQQLAGKPEQPSGGKAGLKAVIGNIVGKSATTAALQLRVEYYQKKAKDKKGENNMFSETCFNKASSRELTNDCKGGKQHVF